jgi:hypothetical protein
MTSFPGGSESGSASSCGSGAFNWQEPIEGETVAAKEHRSILYDVAAN